MADINIVDLPAEMIGKILLSDSLMSEDLVSVASTCRVLQKHVENMNHVWKLKMLRQWPQLQNIKRSNVDWRQEYLNMCRVFKYCKETIAGMSSMYHRAKVSLSECHMEEFYKIADDYDGLGYEYLTIFLRDLCTRQFTYETSLPHDGFYNMTNQYYGDLVLEYLTQRHLKSKWREALLSKTNWIPEKVAMFLDEWLEPKYENFEEAFEKDIGEAVENIIARLPSDHPAKKYSREDRRRFGRETLTDNMYDKPSCESLFKEACRYFTCDLQMSPFSITFRNAVREGKSNKYCVGVILQAALKRCGMKCELIYFPNHHLIQWRENWTNSTPPYHLNPFKCELEPSTGSCPYLNSGSFPRLSSTGYSARNLLLNLTVDFQHMAELKKRSHQRAIEILFFLNPYDPVNLLLLAEIYMDMKRFTSVLEQQLTSILTKPVILCHEQKRRVNHALNQISEFNKRPDETNIKVKHRTSSLRFAIGMVCYHKLYRYSCVIRGWDLVCMASMGWQESMGIAHLEFGNQQPFYQVMAADFTDRYVAQENLWHLRPLNRLECIEERLGIDFTHYNGYFYVPNAEKEKEYPDDFMAREICKNCPV